MKIKDKKFKKVKSTNDIAITLIKKNVSEPTLIIAENKLTVEVDRKKWISKKGNLYLLIF